MPEVVIKAVFRCDLKKSSDLDEYFGAEMLVGIGLALKTLKDISEARKDRIALYIAINYQI